MPKSPPPKVVKGEPAPSPFEHRRLHRLHERAIKLPPLSPPTELAPEQKMVRMIEQTFEEGHTQPEGQLAVDVYHTTDDIVIVAPIAGVSKDDVIVSVTDEVVSIRGKRQPPEFVADENYLTRECFFGPFSRTIILPENVDTTKMHATFHKGVLTITIPKVERVKTRVIPIQP